MTDLPYPAMLGKAPELIPVSNSEIGTFKDCKRKWWLSYYLGLEPKAVKKTGALAFGTRIHKCMEEFYKNGVHPTDTNNLLIAQDREFIITTGTGGQLDDLEKEEAMGQAMMDGYIDWLEETGADSDLEITHSEKKLSALLFNGLVELRGKVDMRVRRRTDNARMPFDFKTVAQYDTYTKIAHMSEQLKLYLTLEIMNADGPEDRVSGGKYRLLKKNMRTAKAKPPFYMDFNVNHNKKTLDNYWVSLHGVIQDMLDLRQQLDAGADPTQVAYPTPTNDCTWKCPFYTACPMFDDGSAVDEYIDDKFTQHDPYERYEEEKEE